MAPSELAVGAPATDGFIEAEGRGNCLAIAFEEAAPAEVVLKVFGRHAVEATHPGFQADVMGIDVLDVEDPIHHPDALLHIDRTVSDSGLTAKVL